MTSHWRLVVGGNPRPFFQHSVIAECSSSVDAIKQIQRLAPDLVFLDIQMPTNSGFDVVREIQADVMPLVVFVTAYDEYALQALMFSRWTTCSSR